MKKRQNIIPLIVFIAVFSCFTSSMAEANALSASFKALPYADDLLRGIFKVGDDASKAATKYGDDAVRFAVHYGDDAAKLVVRTADDTAKITAQTLPTAVIPGDSITRLIIKEGLKPKIIVAAGLAATLPTAGYQVSKGHREAIVAAAKEDPSIMAGRTLGFLTIPIQMGLTIFFPSLALIAIYFFYIGIKRKLSKEQ